MNAIDEALLDTRSMLIGDEGSTAVKIRDDEELSELSPAMLTALTLNS